MPVRGIIQQCNTRIDEEEGRDELEHMYGGDCILVARSGTEFLGGASKQAVWLN
jgi:hypothetical protein